MKRFYPVTANDFQVNGLYVIREMHAELNARLEAAGITQADYNLSDFLRTQDLRDFLVQVGIGSALFNGRTLDLENNAYDLSPLFGATPLQMFWQQNRWVKHGCPIYDLDERLAHAFLDTELRITGKDLRLPLPTFYLAVPHELGLTVFNDQTGEHVLDGFYISLQEHPVDESVGDHGLVTMADGRPGYSCKIPGLSRHFDLPLGMRRSFSVLAVGLPKPGAQFGDDALTHFGIPLDLEEEFEDILFGSKHLPWERMGLNLDRVKTWLRLIVNTALYLCSEDADVQPRKFGVSDALRAKAKKLGGKAGKRLLDDATRKDIRYSVIGKNISLDENVTRHVSGTASERTLTQRFIVRGHWRMQAHGEGRALRKPMWIKPHWKGPTWAEVVSGTRVQKVGEM